MTKLRKKKVCGRCGYLMDYPYIHCNLGEVLEFQNNRIAKPAPKDPTSCKNAREFQIVE